MGSRGVRSVLLATALLLVAACSVPEPNEGSPDRPRTSTTLGTSPNETDGAIGQRSEATLTGRIVTHDGSPLAGLPVTVVEESSGFGLDAALTAVFTLGIACVATPPACDGGPRVVDSATTGQDGTFELTLPDAYLPGYETDEDWVVQVGRAPVTGELTGPSSSFELEVNSFVQASPDLAVWDGTPRITVTGALLRVDVVPITGGAELQNKSTRFVNDAGDVVWGVRGTTVDPRVIEDQSTRLVASGYADVVVRHSNGRTIYHQSVATATVPYVGTLTPLSRGAACTIAAGGLVGCPFTDGDLTTLTTQLGGAVTVDLGAPTDIGLVVVRGTGFAVDDDEVIVEGSVDATTWTRLQHRDLDGDNGWSAGPTAGRGIPSFRYVRIGGSADSVDDLAEVSVWAPTDAERATAEDQPEGSGPGGSGTALPAAAAAALVLAVGVGAFILRRRVQS